jgi:hypothetical protein
MTPIYYIYAYSFFLFISFILIVFDYSKQKEENDIYRKLFFKLGKKNINI